MQHPSLVNRLATALASNENSRLPTATVHSFEDLGNGVALVVCSHTHNAGQKDNFEALANSLGERARPIAGSFRTLPYGSNSRVVSVGYVAANTMIEELTPGRERQMKAVAKNVLMDDADATLWDVSESAGQRFIRRQGHENIAEVLSCVASVRRDISTTASEVGFSYPQAGTYVAFVDKTTQAMNYGFVVASDDNGLQVLPRDGDDLMEVENSMIVANVHDVDTKDQYLKRSLAKVEAGTISAEKLKEYYRRVYTYSPDYLALVEKTIEKQASL